VSPALTAGALLCLPRSLPHLSPRRRSQRAARAAQRARTTLTPTSGGPRSATRKAPATHPRSTRPRSAPTESRRETGTNPQPAAPTPNPYPRTRSRALSPPVTHIHASRPKKWTRQPSIRIVLACEPHHAQIRSRGHRSGHPLSVLVMSAPGPSDDVVSVREEPRQRWFEVSVP